MLMRTWESKVLEGGTRGLNRPHLKTKNIRFVGLSLLGEKVVVV